ncbi:ABC transporter [Streptomyces sp. ME01-24h]|nr:ABC transporter [Streptomyces sp. ME19-03-3]MDX3357075.1 ABC transporter [Streptomyces sp. ME01-24h]
MTATLRYRTALLLRSFRWLPPLLLHLAVMAIGLAARPRPLLDCLGWSAAALLPAAAWLVRAGVTAEPPAARACVAAALGPGRAHTAGALAALLCSVVLGAASTAVVLAIADPHTTDRLKAVPVVPAAAAGLLAVLVTALVGTAVGVLTSPPVLLRPGWAAPVTACTAVLVLVAAGSPAHAAVTGLVTGSRTGAVPFPLVPLLAAALAAAGATWIAAALSARRG